MLIAAIIAALSAGSVHCGSAPNLQPLLDAKPAKFVVLGEVHGTREAPSAFGDWVCSVSEDRPVVVGLEYEDSAQDAFDSWMASDGFPADLRVLVASTAFTRRFEDGRSSQAMLELLEKLRMLKAAGRDIRVVAFRPSSPPADGFDQNYGELAMAQALSVISQARPEALTMVLVGRIHASQQAVGSIRPAFSHFPDRDVLSLSTRSQGGTMWACGGDGPVPECGQKNLGGTDDGSRGIQLNDEPGLFDGTLALGPSTFSPPARDDKPD